MVKQLYIYESKFASDSVISEKSEALISFS